VRQGQEQPSAEIPKIKLSYKTLANPSFQGKPELEAVKGFDIDLSDYCYVLDISTRGPPKILSST
jgi:hypothetical protein